MKFWTIAPQGLVAVLVFMMVVWGASVARRDASLVDRVWGIGFILQAWVYLQAAGGWAAAGWTARLLVILVTIWGLRLSLHISRRNWGHREDFRYRAMRAAHGGHFWWRSLFTVFLIQGALAWIIAAPLLVALQAPDNTIPDPWVVLGTFCWLVGFWCEAVGDWQLARFRSNPQNRGQVMDRGLWRFTRHPNYFGDALLWWGYYCFAVGIGGWWTAFGPGLMTLLLMRVSGVALLEKTLLETKPQYRDYAERTSAFFPRRPRST